MRQANKNKYTEGEMMSDLQWLIDNQTTFQEELGYHFATMSDKERTAYMKEYSLHVVIELGEFLKELPYLKPWKKYNWNNVTSRMQHEKAEEELIDLWHFALNLTIAMGMSADKVINAYARKHQINIKRQENTDEYKRCVDGTEGIQQADNN